MSIDHCKCGNLVDTDYDVEAYENPEKTCLCEPCREEQPEEETFMNSKAIRLLLSSLLLTLLSLSLDSWGLSIYAFALGYRA